jgi:hypothetical protein
MNGLTGGELHGSAQKIVMAFAAAKTAGAVCCIHPVSTQAPWQTWGQVGSMICVDHNGAYPVSRYEYETVPPPAPPRLNITQLSKSRSNLMFVKVHDSTIDWFKFPSVYAYEAF